MNIIAHFDIPYRQIINEEGEQTSSLPAFAHDKKTLQTLYKIMVTIRLFDKKAISLQRTGNMGTYASIHGQEAISTAIGHALLKEDIFIPYYRDYAAQFQRGVRLSEILTYWGGDERGNCFSQNQEDLPISVPIASQCLHAAGIAFALQYKKEARVALVSLGDGGTSEGDFYEAMNIAGAWKLPLVFVVNNNQWAISVPLQQQTACNTIAQKSIAAGFEGLQVDGNDVIAVRDVIHQALEKARKGQGPTLIEAVTYRLCDHTTADDASRYQPQEEVLAARQKEPITRLRRFLEHLTIWDQDQEQTLLQEAENRIEKEVQIYLQRTRQGIENAFDYHFATLPAYLQEQRATAMEEARNA